MGASGGTSGEGFALIIAVWKPADLWNRLRFTFSAGPAGPVVLEDPQDPDPRV